ncbi:hypothetical protein [Hymenobacter siberiensis]|uniref:hypothetical protein n=1 Tax=Hymenobacter siberiensis TaxID=2848396 RepID=UPI001C1E225F|nr:hypothetical protein [Hymenobacter siberiensis]MBU6119650.1 hypothetical protein [Hymenobacter siberiensis]
MKKLVLSALVALAAIAAATPQAQAQTTCPVAPTPIVVSGSITAYSTLLKVRQGKKTGRPDL